MKLKFNLNDLDIPTFNGSDINDIDKLDYPRIDILNYNMSETNNV